MTFCHKISNKNVFLLVNSTRRHIVSKLNDRRLEANRNLLKILFKN